MRGFNKTQDVYVVKRLYNKVYDKNETWLS